MHIHALIIVKKLVITMDKKVLTQLALAIFVGIIFISSYVSLTNYNSQQAATTSTPATYFAQGFAEAKVVGYGTPLYFNLTCKSPATMSIASNIITGNLTILEDNNSVFNFFSSGSNISVEPGNMSEYKIYSFVSGNITPAVSNCISASATVIAELPSMVNLTVETQTAKIQIPQSSANTSILLPINYTIGTSVKVKLSTLVTPNGTVYGPINIIVLK